MFFWGSHTSPGCFFNIFMLCCSDTELIFLFILVILVILALFIFRVTRRGSRHGSFLRVKVNGSCNIVKVKVKVARDSKVKRSTRKWNKATMEKSNVQSALKHLHDSTLWNGTCPSILDNFSFGASSVKKASVGKSTTMNIWKNIQLKHRTTLIFRYALFSKCVSVHFRTD